MKRLSSIALLGAFLAFGIAACDDDTGPEPGVESISVTPDEATVQVGGTANFSASVQTAGGASSAVSWSSGDPSIASIDQNGVVTGESEGSTTVTATSEADPTMKASANVTVTAPEPQKISINGYRAVDNTGGASVQSPDTVGTECCGDSSGKVVLEVTYDVDPGDAQVERVQMTMNGEVVSEQVFSSKEGAAFSHRSQDVVLSKNTLEFPGELDGSVITPDLPNGSYEIGGTVTFSDGTSTSVNQTRTTFVRNHQRVIFSRIDGGNTGVATDGLRWWGGTTINFAATVIDYAGVGVGQLTVQEDDGTADEDFDIGEGDDTPVQFSGPPFTFATDAGDNAGQFGLFDPIVTGDLRDSDGETYASQSIPWVQEYEDPFLQSTASEGMRLDYAAPDASGDIVVVNSAGSNTANMNRFFSVGRFAAQNQTDPGIGIVGSTEFTVRAPAGATEDTIAPADSINDLDERTTEYEVELNVIEDILGNANTSPSTNVTSPFGVDRGSPEFSDKVPSDSLLNEGLVLNRTADDLDFMLLFALADPDLADGNPGSGVDHPASEVELVNADGDVVASATATNGALPGSDFDHDSDDDGTSGDYHVDVADLLDGAGAPDGLYTADLGAQDLAIIPNTSSTSFVEFQVDGTAPTTTMVNPPSNNVTSSNTTLTFTIEGEASDNIGLSSVMVSVREDLAGDPDGDGDNCDLNDPLVNDGGTGNAEQDEFDVTDEADGFSVDVTLNNPGDQTQHVCFFIESSDLAADNTGDPAPNSSDESAHTDIDWDTN